MFKDNVFIAAAVIMEAIQTIDLNRVVGCVHNAS